MDAGWWNLLRLAGVSIENFLGLGFIGQTNFALTNGQASPANVTGASFDSVLYTSATLACEITQKTSTGELVFCGVIRMFWRPFSAAWDVVFSGDGDDPGIVFSVVTTGTVGQLQYTLGTLSGSSYVGKIKFTATTIGV